MAKRKAASNMVLLGVSVGQAWVREAPVCSLVATEDGSDQQAGRQ